MLLRTLVGGMARDLARESLANAVQEAETRKQRPDEPCSVLVIFALNVESGGLIDMLEELNTTRAATFVEHTGTLDGRRLVVVDSGVGRAAATAAARDAIRLNRPSWVISAGFAGGLVDPLRRGHMVLASEVIDSAGVRTAVGLSVDRQSVEADERLHIGTLATVDEIVDSPEAKRELGRRLGAIACDMETSAVAQVCAELDVRLLSVRIVSDTVDDQLPPEVATLVTQKSWAGKLGAATGALFKRPSSALDMWKLKEDALKASDRLGRFLRGMIAQLPDEPAPPPRE